MQEDDFGDGAELFSSFAREAHSPMPVLPLIAAADAR